MLQNDLSSSAIALVQFPTIFQFCAFFAETKTAKISRDSFIFRRNCFRFQSEMKITEIHGLDRSNFATDPQKFKIDKLLYNKCPR